MPRHNKQSDGGAIRRPSPATTPEGRESRMIAMAMDRAEQQLADGTASAQVITHFLKLGSMKEQDERERLRLENELVRAKTDNLQSQKDTNVDYRRVMDALRKYSGGAIGGDDGE